MQFSTVSSHPQAFAFSAMPFDMSMSVDKLEILTFQKMATVAMGLPGIHSDWPIAPHAILDGRNKFQVSGIYTDRIPAKMVRNQPNSNGANEHFIGESGGEMIMPLEPKTTIAISIGGVKPEPALSQIGAQGGQRAILVDLLPKSFLGTKESLMISIVSHAVHTTTSD